MSRLLIPDAGPLFSLAAGGLLDLLARFSLIVTDVVKEETFDCGLKDGCSIEASRLLAFYNKHAVNILVAETQVGHLLNAARLSDSQFTAPRNLGELSIQSYLIESAISLSRTASRTELPLVLFEDAWFLRHAPSLAAPCILMSTEAFLINAQRLGLITSAAQARAAISAVRPNASKLYTQQKIGPPE